MMLSNSNNNSSSTAFPSPPASTQNPHNYIRNADKRNLRQSEHESRLDFDRIFRRDNFVRFYLITAKDRSNLAEIDSIAGNEDLQRHLKGSPKEISEMRSGQLLIEVMNRQQSNDIASLKSLAGVEVEVTKHDKMNQIKGTIRYENRPQFTDDQILKTLKKYDVVDIYRFKRRVNNNLSPLPVYLITFNGNSLPEHICIGWTKCIVRAYIPRPRRCFKCQKYGHGARNCRSEGNICLTCGKEIDENHQRPCTMPAHCVNCGEGHPANDMKCDAYRQEAEILAVQTRERIKFSEAKRLVLSRRAKPSESYANVTARARQDKNSETSMTNKSVTGATKNNYGSDIVPPSVNRSSSETSGANNNQQHNFLQDCNEISLPSNERLLSSQEEEPRNNKKRTLSLSEPSGKGKGKKSLLTNFPMPPNMPTCLPPKPGWKQPSSSSSESGSKVGDRQTINKTKI